MWYFRIEWIIKEIDKFKHIIFTDNVDEEKRLEGGHMK